MREIAGPESRGPTRVAVCVATCLRPQGLRRLLAGLGELSFARVSRPDYEVIVVDNDAARSAEPVVADAARRLSCPVRYVVEPRRGISYARNAAVQAALAGEFDFVAFLDDDERPAPPWLDELLGAMVEYQADVVAGPVEPLFEDGYAVPGWITRGRFFDRPQLDSGTVLKSAAGGNVLMHARVLAGGGIVFDERRALVGGEDTHLFLRLGLAGYRIVWEARARAVEWQPPNRVRLGWLVRRAFRTSSNWADCERELAGTPSTLAVRTLKGAWLAVTGLLLVPWGAIGGRHLTARGLVRAARGAGFLAGILGVQYAEYRTIHGS